MYAKVCITNCQCLLLTDLHTIAVTYKHCLVEAGILVAMAKQPFRACQTCMGGGGNETIKTVLAHC